jgi:DNA-binding Lrp family transcriptional regulator
MLREAAAILAARSESLWVYTVAGANEAAAEIFCPPERLSSFLLDEMSALPGLTDYSAHPVLRYFRTIDDWHPELSDGSPIASLSYAQVKQEMPQFGPPIELSTEDRTLVNCLKQNGRMTHEELGSAAGMSKATAGRRVEALRSSGLISIRAVVEPALLGYPVEAILWIKAPPAAVESVGSALASTPEVRYAAAIGGGHQLIAQVAMPSRTALHSLLAGSSWTVDVHSVETSIVMDVHKRSDIVPASYDGND